MAGRAIPLIAVFFTILAIVAILQVLLPGVIQNMPQDLYLVTANITGLNKEMLPSLHVDPTVAKALAWGDYVSVGLWNACARHQNKDTHDIMCTTPSISYSFHPSSIWSMNETAKVPVTLSQKVLDTLDTQSMNTVLIKIFFLIGLGISAVCMVVGGIGACVGGGNRHPAFKRRILGLIALFSVISTILLIAGAGVATRAFRGLLDVMNPTFGGYIIFNVGTAAFAMLWVSAVLALLASVFWIQSWRKEHKYKRLQPVGGQTAWNKGGVEVHVHEEPSAEARDDKPLLQKDTAYHSPPHP